MANTREDIKKLLEFNSATKEYFEDIDVSIIESPFEKQRRIKALEKDPIKWMHYYFKNYITCSFSKHHKEFINYIIDNNEIYTVLSAFRGFGKSVLTTILLPAYLSIVKGEGKLVLVVGNTYDKAEKLVLSLQADFNYNKLLMRDYETQSVVGNNKKGDYKNKYGRFMAMGMQTSVRGIREGQYRPDLIICDDLDTMSKSISQVLLNRNLNYITKDLWGTFSSIKGANRRFIMSNNLFSRNTITYKLTEHCKRNKYKTFKINLLNDKGQSNWKQAIPLSEINKIRESRSNSDFLCEYMNSPAIDDDNMFNTDDIKYNQLKYDIYKDKIITYIDPSYTDKGDYKAVCSIINIGDKYYVDEVFCKKTGYSELAKHLSMVSNKYRYYNQIWIEYNNGSDLVKKELREYNKDLKIYTDRTKKGNKEYRIEGLQRYFKEGLIVFNKLIEGADYIDQLLLYPNVKNDDFPDALEGAIARFESMKSLEKFFN